MFIVYLDAMVTGGASNSPHDVVADGNIITSRGPATAMEFSLEIVRNLFGDEKYEEISKQLLYNRAKKA